MTKSEASSVDEIVAELQAEVRRYQGTLREESPAIGRIGKEAGLAAGPDPLVRVCMSQHVNSHLPIGWPDMPPGLLPKLRAYTQKIMRRLLRWYINPLVDQQNVFNTAVTEALISLSVRMEQQEELVRERQGKAEKEEHGRSKDKKE
jgi:hypothetical protein